MTRSEIAAAAVLALLACSVQSLSFHGLRHDDAYITFRYAANLASGEGLVFNAGESVMGSTSPGHALIGALIYPLTSHSTFPALMSIMGCVGWALQSLTVFALLRAPLGRGAASFVALCVAAGAAWSHRYVAL